MADDIGTLAPDTRADITILEELEGEWVFVDSSDDRLTTHRRLAPTTVVRAGRPIARPADSSATFCRVRSQASPSTLRQAGVTRCWRRRPLPGHRGCDQRDDDAGKESERAPVARRCRRVGGMHPGGAWLIHAHLPDCGSAWRRPSMGTWLLTAGSRGASRRAAVRHVPGRSRRGGPQRPHLGVGAGRGDHAVLRRHGSVSVGEAGADGLPAGTSVYVNTFDDCRYMFDRCNRFSLCEHRRVRTWVPPSRTRLRVGGGCPPDRWSTSTSVAIAACSPDAPRPSRSDCRQRHPASTPTARCSETRRSRGQWRHWVARSPGRRSVRRRLSEVGTSASASRTSPESRTPTNVELILEAVELGRRLGRHVATPAQAADLLALKPLGRLQAVSDEAALGRSSLTALQHSIRAMSNRRPMTLIAHRSLPSEVDEHQAPAGLATASGDCCETEDGLRVRTVRVG